jgi:hypothetical protein
MAESKDGLSFLFLRWKWLSIRVILFVIIFDYNFCFQVLVWFVFLVFFSDNSLIWLADEILSLRIWQCVESGVSKLIFFFFTWKMNLNSLGSFGLWCLYFSLLLRWLRFYSAWSFQLICLIVMMLLTYRFLTTEIIFDYRSFSRLLQSRLALLLL